MNSNISQLELKKCLWADLVTDLRSRGAAKRESGAFLLGRIEGATRQVDSWVPYDILDPAALSNGYVRLGTQARSGPAQLDRFSDFLSEFSAV